jgi:hypothetical protein
MHVVSTSKREDIIQTDSSWILHDIKLIREISLPKIRLFHEFITYIYLYVIAPINVKPVYIRGEYMYMYIPVGIWWRFDFLKKVSAKCSP